MDPQTLCPCCSGQTYSQCCRHYHQGKPAPNPETLMRSRYCAFVLNDIGYLNTTWHPDTRPEALSLDQSPDWTSLRILSASEKGDQGQVRFKAFYRDASQWGCLEECSRFTYQDGYWYYLEGDARQSAYKPGRNEPCPCGSGRKFKTCCGGS